MRKLKINPEILNAIIWAILIIASSIFAENKSLLFSIIIAGYAFSFPLINRLVHKKKTPCVKKYS